MATTFLQAVEVVDLFVTCRAHHANALASFAWHSFGGELDGETCPAQLERTEYAPVSGARAQAVKFARFEAVQGELMEIAVGDVVVRIAGEVQAERLAAVIRAVRQA